jgi:predicted phage tail protein
MPWIPGGSSGSGGWTWVGDGVPDTPFPGSNTSYLDPTATTSDTDKPVEHGRVMLAVGEGPHAGLVNGLKSVYLNDVPVQNADGTLNFNDVSVAVVNGTLNQKPISGFEGAESEVGVGQKVLKATPIVRSISNTTATHARVKISVPSLQTIDTTTGKTSSAHLSYKIEVQPNGGSYQAVTLGDGGVIEKQFTSKLIKGYKFALPGTGPWNIRLTRLEVDSYSQYLQNDLYFESLATIIDGRYSYPMTACLAVACNANQFNSIP